MRVNKCAILGCWKCSDMSRPEHIVALEYLQDEEVVCLHSQAIRWKELGLQPVEHALHPVYALVCPEDILDEAWLQSQVILFIQPHLYFLPLMTELQACISGGPMHLQRSKGTKLMIPFVVLVSDSMTWYMRPLRSCKLQKDMGL